MTPLAYRVRRARHADAEAISRLNNTFASEGQMLRRSVETIALAIDEYVVVEATDGALLACGALKEYSPSVAEVAAIAVARTCHGRGLGRVIVGAVSREAPSRLPWLCATVRVRRTLLRQVARDRGARAGRVARKRRAAM